MVFFKVMWPFNDDVPSGFRISHKRKVYDPFPLVLGLKVSLSKAPILTARIYHTGDFIKLKRPILSETEILEVC